jgi:hypothetical protein
MDRQLDGTGLDDAVVGSEPGDDDLPGPEAVPNECGVRGRLAAIAGLIGLALSGASIERAGAQRNARTTTAQSGRRTNDLLRTRRAQRALTLEQGNNLDLIVTCPRNMAAVGSGYSLPPGAAPNVALVSSYPLDTDSSRSWVFGFRNRHRSRVRVNLFVVCTPVRR